MFVGNRKKTAFATKSLTKTECLNPDISSGSPTAQHSTLSDDHHLKNVLNYFPTQFVNRQEDPII